KYVQNEPILRIDPSGALTITPLGQAIGRGTCGQKTFIQWDFEVDGGAPCTGFLVQKITQFCSINPCTGKCPAAFLPYLFTGGPMAQGTVEIVYWEAWKVQQKATLAPRPIVPVPGFGNVKLPFTDESFVIPRKNECGSALALGEVRFYCEKAK